MWRDELMGMLPKLYRDDPWLLQVLGAAGDTLDRLEKQLAELHENRYFDGMTFALPIWEQILAVLARKNATDDDRRAALRAKWLTCRKADRELLQAIADSWMEDTVEVGFDAGYILLDIIAFDAVMENLDALLQTIESVKPAHLPIKTTISYPKNGTQFVGFTVQIADVITC